MLICPMPPPPPPPDPNEWLKSKTCTVHSLYVYVTCVAVINENNEDFPHLKHSSLENIETS